MKLEKHIIKGHFKGKRPHVKVTAYELSAVDCSADRMSGYYSQESTLISDDPEPGYDFAGWSVTGSNVTGNNVRFEGDITAKANYSAHKYNVTLQNDGHGTIAANKTTGNIGDTITLSNTAAEDYGFSGYSITGATLTSNQFNIQTSDVTAKAWFSALPITYYKFSLQNTNNNVAYYVKITTPKSTTAELIVPSGSNGAIASGTFPSGSTYSGYVLANPYYRTTLNQGNVSNYTTAKSTADPRRKTFTGVIASDNGWIGTQNTQQNSVKWTWTFNNNNRPNWTANNGGILGIYLTPNTGRMTINSCYADGSAYCCRLLSDQFSGYYYGASGKPVNSKTSAIDAVKIKQNIATTRIASLDSNKWLNVYQSAHIALTGYAWHPNSVWIGTATNGGQRGLKANYLVNGTQVADPGKNINNTFYDMYNTAKSTAFNLTGTGNNMAPTTWNNQAIYVYATLGLNSDGISNATKYPPNQITACTATVICSAILP